MEYCIILYHILQDFMFLHYNTNNNIIPSNINQFILYLKANTIFFHSDLYTQRNL